MAEDIVEKIRLAKKEKAEQMERVKKERVEQTIAELKNLGLGTKECVVNGGRVKHPDLIGEFIYSDGELSQVIDYGIPYHPGQFHKVESLADIQLPTGRREKHGDDLWGYIGRKARDDFLPPRRNWRSWFMKMVYVVEARKDGNVKVNVLSLRKARKMGIIGSPIKFDWDSTLLFGPKDKIWVCNRFETYRWGRRAPGVIHYPETIEKANLIDVGKW